MSVSYVDKFVRGVQMMGLVVVGHHYVDATPFWRLDMFFITI